MSYRVKISFDEDAFEKYGMWVLDPCRLIEHYGRIDFDTITFFDEEEKEFTPEGGGKNRFVNISKIDKDQEIIAEFYEKDLLPDPWLLYMRTIYIEYNILTD